MRTAELSRQNALAAASLPAYLLSRPWLRRQQRLLPAAEGPWVFGGHSGRMYADNAAAVHARAHELGREVYFVVQTAALERELSARGYRTLRRNSTAARIAIENAAVLVYSHGLTDLDHVLPRVVSLRGLKVDVSHALTMLKGRRTRELQPGTALPREQRGKNPRFDHSLAVSPRERRNRARWFPGYEDGIVLGGGAHLDPFMQARGNEPARSIVYCPTHRDTPALRARLEQTIERLVSDPRLLAWLERDDRTLEVVSHINRAAHDDGSARTEHPRVRRLPPTQLAESILRGAAFISDYSGLLFDQLALGRPTLFFPFDHADYVKERLLFENYAELSWGPHAHSVDALVDLLVSGRYRDQQAFAAGRAYWERECFPRLTPGYTDDSLRTIDRLLAERRGLVTAPPSVRDSVRTTEAP
jgi:hypothetical protein